jgi:hypothetical protein
MAPHGEPEAELVRRVMPFWPPAVALAFVVGTAVAGHDVGWSAAIGVGIVAANFLASGVSVVRAGRRSMHALFLVSAVGIPARLGLILALMFLLNRFSFFSPLAFGLAVVPALVLLLAYEMKVWSGPLGRELDLEPRDRVRR